MLGQLEASHARAIVESRETHARVLERPAIPFIESVVAVIALLDLALAVQLANTRAGIQRDASAHFHHGARKRCDDDVVCIRIRFGVVRARNAEHVACVLDDCVLEAAARAEKGTVAFAREADRAERAIHVAVRTRRHAPQSMHVSDDLRSVGELVGGEPGGVHVQVQSVPRERQCTRNGLMRRDLWVVITDQAYAHRIHAFPQQQTEPPFSLHSIYNSSARDESLFLTGRAANMDVRTLNRSVILSEPRDADDTGEDISRREFLYFGGIAAAAAATTSGHLLTPHLAVPPAARVTSVPPHEIDEATVAQLQELMRSGDETSGTLTEHYLQCIEDLDKKGPTLRAILETNPDAVDIAHALDDERKAGRVRGPLHGIPIVIKGNIDTRDRMSTTAGSLALAGSIAPRDAFIVEKLRAAGAVIIAKANLSEWANFRSTHSSSGWSGQGGQGKNPYVLDRNTCGSSSGSGQATAANMTALSIGTETDGSIVCPSSAQALVGIKPTLGLWSRAGIIPIAQSQDTAGPMARTVTDAAILLGALTGTDPRDPATSRSAGKALVDYTKSLVAQGLRGARIGVAREKLTGYSYDADRLFAKALDAMKALGAVIVDPANIPHVGRYDDTENTVLQYEFKHGINAYLASLGPNAPMKSLKDVIAFNEQHAAEEMPYFAQEIFLQSQKRGPLTDKKYLAAFARNRRLSRTEGIDAAMLKHKLDAIVCPTGNPAWPTDLVNGDHFTGGSSTPAAVAGYPSITVPMGYALGSLPVGLSFIGRAWSEALLIRLAYSFEQATMHRKAPRFLPTVELPRS
jgi:amidase